MSRPPPCPPAPNQDWQLLSPPLALDLAATQIRIVVEVLHLLVMSFLSWFNPSGDAYDFTIG
jgi:hypothetical protein